MTHESVQRARASFRQRRITPSYSGPLHLATTISIAVAVAAFSVAMLHDVSVLEWLTVPVTFLYANVSEYLGHRGPMHRRNRFLSAIFVRHSIEHHAFFTNEAPEFESSQDYKAVLFPPLMIFFFFGFFAVPVGALLYFFVSANVCYLFVATAILYFLNYELLHFAYHMSSASWVGRLPFIRRLRKHHIVHHDPSLMTSYNFNITYPICDALFGTLYRSRS